MTLQHSSPKAKLEAIMVKLLVPTSTSGNGCTSFSDTVNPMDLLKPTYHINEALGLDLFLDKEESVSNSETFPKKSVKRSSTRRKSSGQALPQPKTNLPPGKRAKTEDEKEQRRVERVLRNRRAAQSSRERKRLEMEALQMKSRALETALANTERANISLAEELNRAHQMSHTEMCVSPATDPFRNKPIEVPGQPFRLQDASGPVAKMANQLSLSSFGTIVDSATGLSDVSLFYDTSLEFD